MHRPHLQGECLRLPPKDAQTACQAVFDWFAILLSSQRLLTTFRLAKRNEKGGISGLFDGSLAASGMGIVVQEKVVKLGDFVRLER